VPIAHDELRRLDDVQPAEREDEARREKEHKGDGLRRRDAVEAEQIDRRDGEHDTEAQDLLRPETVQMHRATQPAGAARTCEDRPVSEALARIKMLASAL
jgi:hypothetical protein